MFEVESDSWEVVGVDLIFSNFSEVVLFLGRERGTYPICSLGVFVMVARGVLCFWEMN